MLNAVFENTKKNTYNLKEKLWTVTLSKTNCEILLLDGTMQPHCTRPAAPTRGFTHPQHTPVGIPIHEHEYLEKLVEKDASTWVLSVP